MVKRTGVARKVDQLGRVVLPAEVRRRFGIQPGDMIEIAVDSDAILLTKVEDCCVFCGSGAALIEFSGKLVCRRCVSRLKTERPAAG
jgi:AbrB family transcriptional regulator, transcriptional pleiotropic regulator of transition state genes